MFHVKSNNPNYLAKFIKLPAPIPHGNADKLQKVIIDGSCVITGMDAKEGDLYIHFPLESALNKDYLSFTNSFQEKEKNKDVEVKGFFHKSGRVKAVKLRGVPSEGYIVPVSSVIKWLESTGAKVNFTEDLVGKEFDSFEEILICEKYVIPVKGNPSERKLNKKVRQESKIVENQFRLSEDTENLKRNMFKINPEDYISLSYKIHGANMSMGKVLCKRPLNFIEKALKFLGVKINDTQYDLVFASRKLIKNAYADKKVGSFYDHDIWADIAEKYKNCLKDGITLYGEIINQAPTGAWIQKDYDYGLAEKTSDLLVYRITSTNASGDVIEFTTPQIQRYCELMGLKTVPIFYYGKARDWNPNIDTQNHWHDNFLQALLEKYTEKNCYICKNKVPEEGIVLVKEAAFFEAYKLKSFAFFERETKLLDNNETNMEDMEEANNE